jgi:hypothetical protein
MAKFYLIEESKKWSKEEVLKNLQTVLGEEKEEKIIEFASNLCQDAI